MRARRLHVRAELTAQQLVRFGDGRDADVPTWARRCCPAACCRLHVFEPRYRQLVHDILADDVDAPEFGVVMIERGREVGGGDTRTHVGTVARVRRHASACPTAATRWSLSAPTGCASTRWLPDDPYPLADIDSGPTTISGSIDLDEAARDDRGTCTSACATLNDEVRALGEMTPPPDTEIADDPHLALYHLGSLAPLGPADRQRHARGAHARRAAGRVRGARSTTPRLWSGFARRDRTRAHVRRIASQPSRAASPPRSARSSSTSRTYAIQETVGPLKGAGRWIGVGAGGAVVARPRDDAAHARAAATDPDRVGRHRRGRHVVDPLRDRVRRHRRC